MKTTSMIVTASLLLSSAAFAEDTAEQTRVLDPDLVRSGYYLRQEYYAKQKIGDKQEYTNDQINRALEFMGQPPLGSSRVLPDDRSKTTRMEINSTITVK